MSRQVNKTTKDKMYLHIGSCLPLTIKKWTIQINYDNIHMKTKKSDES